MDRFIITDLGTRCIVGVNDDERREAQDVTINLSICGDFRKSGLSDQLEDAVDYRALKKRILAMVEKSQFFLLEALVEAVATNCLATSGSTKVRVRIDKPSALRFARSVGWKSNGRAAIRALAVETRVVAISTIYKTDPESRSNQPSFYNGDVEIETERAPRELKFGLLRAIEAGLGRRRTSDKDAARSIDLDLLLYNNLVHKAGGLVLPDPDVTHRSVVAIPLAELSP